MEKGKLSIKTKILNNLSQQGFEVNADGIITPNPIQTKDYIRNLHKHFRNEKIKAETKFIKESYAEVKSFFADGKSINPKDFDPYIVEVKANTIFSKLFRFGTLLWSIPVSQGFGRRIRFLVFDKQNDKLVGLFAIGDPVFNLNIRDSLIGWDQAMRKKRLYNIMDMFIVGAVPPYSNLLCGKLMAILGASNEVRKTVWEKYKNQFTTIVKEKKRPHLVLLTTSSALGRSSLYNRIKYNGNNLFSFIGSTEGWGHFHLSNSTFSLIKEYLVGIDHPIIKANRFGQGPNWKIRTIRTCLELLDLPATMLNHGIKRHVYIAPLASNYVEFLLGKDKKPIYYNLPSCELIEHFKTRWFLPRSIRCPEYKSITAIDTINEFRKITHAAYLE